MSDSSVLLDYRAIIKLRVLQDSLYTMLNRVEHLSADLMAFGIVHGGTEIMQNEITAVLEKIHSRMEVALKEPSVWKNK